MKRTRAVWMACLAVACVVVLSTGSRARAEESFWIDGLMPAPEGQNIHNFLTAPGGPLESFLGKFFMYDNSNGQKGVLRYNALKTWDGYTLLNAIGGAYVKDGKQYQAILIDMNGNVVNAWQMRSAPAKMLPGGYVIGGAGTGLTGHVEAGRVIQQDWCGREVWSWNGEDPANGGARWHHDFEREGSPTGYYAPHQKAKAFGGKTLVLVHENPPMSLTSHISSHFALEEDAFYEIDVNGTVSWKWRPWEHVDQLGFDEAARWAIDHIKSSDPTFVGGGAAETDWQHVNALSYVGPNKWFDKGDLRFAPDNVIWDGRTTNIIAIVARRDHPDGKTWKAGDVVWRLGPNFDSGSPEHRVGQIIGQHHAHIIPEGLPGAGNVLVYDNGGLAGYGLLFPGQPAEYGFYPNKLRSYSRVLEINPQTYEVVWEYKHPVTTDSARQFFSWFISSAQRLENGNTMITEGANGRVFEVTHSGEIVWEYISPFKGPIPQLRNATYRAYRIPESWLPLNRTCPQPAGGSLVGNAQ